jgi:hypothetical protein
MLEELGASTGVAAAQHQGFEQSKFFPCELDRNFGAFDSAAQAVERDIVPPQDGVSGALATAKDGAAAGCEFLKAEGLDEEVVSPEIEAADALPNLSAPSENEYGGVRGFARKMFQNLVTISLRKSKVENDEIRYPATSSLYGGLAVTDPFNFKTFGRKALLEKHPQGVIVLYD